MNHSKKLIAAMLLVFAAFIANCQSKSTAKEMAPFSFNDGETIYTLDDTKVVPPFKNKTLVLDEAIIDTIRDPDDLNIILAIDTLIGKEFRYAKKFSYSYDVLSQELKNIFEKAKAQGFEVIQTKFIIFWEEGVYAQFRLPTAEELEGTTKVCLSIRLRKNNLSMEYPLLFAD